LGSISEGSQKEFVSRTNSAVTPRVVYIFSHYWDLAGNSRKQKVEIRSTDKRTAGLRDREIIRQPGQRARGRRRSKATGGQGNVRQGNEDRKCPHEPRSAVVPTADSCTVSVRGPETAGGKLAGRKTTFMPSIFLSSRCPPKSPGRSCDRPELFRKLIWPPLRPRDSLGRNGQCSPQTAATAKHRRASLQVPGYGVMSRTEGKNVRTRRGSRVSSGRCAT
jgi:hypothetical protein